MNLIILELLEDYFQIPITARVNLTVFYYLGTFSHLFNSRGGGGNTRGGDAKVVKSIDVEEGINIDRVQKL